MLFFFQMLAMDNMFTFLCKYVYWKWMFTFKKIYLSGITIMCIFTLLFVTLVFYNWKTVTINS